MSEKPDLPAAKLSKEISALVIPRLEAKDVTPSEAVTALTDVLAHLIGAEPRRSARRGVTRSVVQVLPGHVEKRFHERCARDPAFQAAVLQLNPVNPKPGAKRR